MLSQNGNLNLGGRDFDNHLIKHFMQILISNHKMKELGNKKYKLMLEYQKIKESLSIVEEDIFDIQEFVPSKESFVVITCFEFEKMAVKLLHDIKKCVTEILNKCFLNPQNIEKILLVGGRSRMPMIQKLLQKLFPEAEHCFTKHPDELVAIGAAYHAFQMNSVLKLDRKLGPVEYIVRKRKNGISAGYMSSFAYSNKK